MARGWESKSVEAQQADAIDKSNKPHARLSAEDAAAIRKKEGLRLARQRVLQQIEATSNARHRKVMQEALDDLDEKLRALE